MGGAHSKGVGGVGPKDRSFQDIYPEYVYSKNGNNAKKVVDPKRSTTLIIELNCD
jgi:hypothetical protein